MDHFRKIGGYGTESDLSGQDWIGFLRLVNAGYPVDILPEHLLYIPVRENDFGASRNDSLKQQRVLHSFFQADRLLAAERVALWSAFATMQGRQEQAERRLKELVEENQASGSAAKPYVTSLPIALPCSLAACLLLNGASGGCWGTLCCR